MVKALVAGFLVGKDFLFGRNERAADGWGVGCGETLADDGGLLRDEAQPGQRMQMQPVILAADQEEQAGRFAIRRAEMDFLQRPFVRDYLHGGLYDRIQR